MQARNQQFAQKGPAGVVPSVFNQRLIEQWEPILEGVSDMRYRSVLATVLQNTLEEIQRRGGSLVEDDTTSANAGAYAKTIFTLLRRLFPNLITPDIVSVQPMNGPSGLVFFLQLLYDRSKGLTAAGTEMINTFDRNYASEFVQYERLIVADGVNYGGPAGAVLSTVLQWTPVRPFNATAGYSVLVEDVQTGVAGDEANWTVDQRAIDNGSGGFTFIPAGANTAGSITYESGALVGFKFQNAPTATNTIRVTYFYNNEKNDRIPAIAGNITSQAVQATTRKLKYTWSIEGADDLMAYHGVDADSLLTASAAQEIALELDRTILNALFAAASGIQGAFDFTVPPGVNPQDHNASVVVRMSDLSARVFQATHRGWANWFVTTPRVAARVKTPQIHGDYRGVYSKDFASPAGAFDGQPVPPSHGPTTAHMGIQRMGVVSDSWLGFVDPYMAANWMLMGYRGESWEDAGYAWSPYVPLYITAPFEDPDDMTRKRGMMTRDALTLLRANHYARMQITGGL
jgi:hypothetical protein